MTRDAWLRAHPYLVPVAGLCARVESAAAGLAAPSPGAPRFDDHAADHAAGVPLLASVHAPELEPAGALVEALVARLADGPASDGLAAGARLLRDELAFPGGGPRSVVDWLLGEDESWSPSSPGLLRFLGWTALARHLRPLLAAFAGWRQEERWLRGTCPACGALPAMAQLVGKDPGRLRLLVCGCCGTRWRYQRTGCPFCEKDVQRLGIVTIEGEAPLRIDHCTECRGYLKTYDGEGAEGVLLLDWTSLHLDVIASDRGLERRATSLYDLDLPGAGALDPARARGNLAP